MSQFIDNFQQIPYLNPKDIVSINMTKPFQYVTVKVISNSLEDGNFVALVEYYDGSKSIIPSIESVKPNELVLVSRELVSMNDKPFTTADKVVRVLTKEEEKMFNDLKDNFIKAKELQKKQEENKAKQTYFG
jgi:hypothetical protein